MLLYLHVYIYRMLVKSAFIAFHYTEIHGWQFKDLAWAIGNLEYLEST
jgi:hypothetical protein